MEAALAALERELDELILRGAARLPGGGVLRDQGG
jgi:hypothetical protein